MTLHHLLLPTLLLSACATDLPGQYGEDEDLVCVESGADAVADDATVVLGTEGAEVLVADLLALATGTFTETLTWLSTGEETGVSLDATAEAGSAELVHYAPASEEIPAGNCPDLLRFSVAGSLATDDGRLAESLSTQAISDGQSVFLDARLSPLSGTLDPTALSPAEVEPDQAHLHAILQDSSAPFQGQVAPVLTADPDGDVTPLGTWPGELE